jgi:hypothetical protein
MNDWTRSYVAAEVVQAGYQCPVILAEARSGGATVVVCEATRRGATAMFAFGFEQLEDGERMPSGAIRAPYRDVDRGASSGRADPWLAFGAWSDLDPERRVIVGRVRNPAATTCRVVSSARTETVPVREGLVIAWVDAGRDVRYEVH